MNDNVSDNTVIRWWHIGLLLGGALLVRLVFLVGVTGSDDLQYAWQAQLMSQGHFSPGDYFANFRVGIIAPTALAFRLFGISTASTVWFVMFCSLLGVWAAYLVGKDLFGPAAGFWACAVYAVLPIDVVGAGLLLPDICVAALTALALVCVLRGERATRLSTRVVLFALAGVLVGAGYLCKMTALMTMVILVAYLIIRRVPMNRDGWRFLVLAGLAGVLVIEAVFYRVTEGQFLYRFSVTGGWNHAIADGKLAGQLASLTEYPRAMFLSIEEFGLFWYLVVAAAVWAVAARLRRAWVVALWVVPIWLLLEFGIASLRQWTFPAHVPRYLTLVTIPAAALIGAMFARLAERGHRVVLWVLAGATLAGSLFLAGLHATLLESTVWNPRQVAQKLGELPGRPTYVLFGKAVINWLAEPEKLDIRDLYRRHDPQSGGDSDPRPLDELAGSYVVVDHRLIRFHTARQELTLPDYLVEVPSNWRKLVVIHNDFSGVRYVPIRLVAWAIEKRLLPGPVGARFARTVGTVMQQNECVIYEVPQSSGSL